MNKKVVVFIIGFFQALLVFSQSGGTDCNNLEPICTDVGISFTASSGIPDASITSPGNNYDCLFSEPNPTWYYLEISNTGDVLMNLSAGSDIDYIIWGPFASLTDAEANCGSYNNVVDCSYSFTNNETPQILGAVAGQVYVVLVTNYANVVQNITLTQSGGSGNTDCTIVNPPTANCPDYATQASSANEACGNQQYYLEVLNTACNGFVTFNIVGNYGSSYASEITWEVVSNQTGSAVASGGPGINGGAINVVVGPLDPAVHGTIFNLLVYDSWGDGFNGTGGIIQTTSSSGTVLAEIDGDFGSQSNQYFTAGIGISSATINITTPSGVVTTTMGNCQDFNVELTLENNNFCTPIIVDLPWEIICDATGAIISNGTHSITVYPQVPTQSSEVVSISWDAANCSWDVSANNDCDLLDLGTLFSVSPDPSTIAPYCSSGSENFTIDYLGFVAGPNCCQTAGPLTPITYDTTLNTTSFTAQDAYAGTNNAGYAVVSANGIGGNAQSIVVDITGNGYCCPNCSASPEPYYVDVYIDYVQVLFEGPLTNTSFSYSFNEGDLGALGVTYNQSSIIEVYVLPNNFWFGTPQIFTTFIPGGNCGSLGAGQWTMSNLITNVSAVFEQQTATAVSCSYPLIENYTCCSPNMVLPPNESSSVSCDQDIYVPVPPIINDNCGTAISPTMSENATPVCVGDKVYTFTYMDCTGATSDWTYTLHVNDNMPPTASNPTDITVAFAPAPSPDVNLVLDEADNCTASPVVAFVSDVSDGNSCPETITRTYSVTDDCGNETLLTQLILIGGAPVPDPSVIANGPVCEGGDAEFTITGIPDGIVTYDTGSGPNTVTLTGGSATITVSGVTTNTTITLTNISEGSCSSELNLTATTVVTPELPPTFDGLGPYCENGPAVVTLPTTSNEGITGSWNTVNVDMAAVGSTVYTFTSDASQCALNTTMDIIIDPAPIVSITNNTGSTELTCVLIDINLTATGADTYSWDNGLGISDNVIIDAPGTYTVTGFSLNGCQSSSLIVITEQNTVDIIVNLAEDEICSGEDALISVSSSNATSFDWIVLENGVSGATAGSGINAPGLDISQTLIATGGNPGTVEYTITPLLGTCTGIPQSVMVTVTPPITPTFTGLGPYCLNESTIDMLVPISNDNISGTWSPNTISTSTLGSSTYTFTPATGECATNTTMEIIVNSSPTVVFSADYLEGCAPLTSSLTGGSATGNNIWTIGNGEILNGTNVNTTFTLPGCYDVTLFVEENGCSNTMTIADYICVQNAPTASFTFNPQTFTDVNQEVTFSNNSQGATSYTWDFGEGSTSETTNPSHTYFNTEDGVVITLTATSEFGCTHTIDHFIPYNEQEIYYIPNTFTPDGDNFNQVFSPVFYSGFDPYNFSMLIFNMWGEVVFETHNAVVGWDGSFGPTDGLVADGMYTWKITYKNPQTDERKIVVGHVTLLR